MPVRSRRSTAWPQMIYIVRHGESAGNVARDAALAAREPVIQLATRDVDVPLSLLGERQATALGRWFAELPADEKPTVVIASPYVRARQTAEIITGLGGFPYASAEARLVVDERFREKEFGILDGLTKYGIAERFPQQAQLRQSLGKFYHRPPGGESWCDVVLRLRSAFEMMCHEYFGQRVLVVCHSVVVLCMRYIIEQLTEEQLLRIDREQDVANCSLTRFDVDPDQGTIGKLTLRAYNFVAPLAIEGAPITTTPDVPQGAK
ncbi:MAG TPA: histidine phosphatase family protein [Candidatus Elarobacter sp.]|nr:histidine phosphatase family protein [Candidatus Elarobacter sp.]